VVCNSLCFHATLPGALEGGGLLPVFAHPFAGGVAGRALPLDEVRAALLLLLFGEFRKEPLPLPLPLPLLLLLPEEDIFFFSKNY